MSDYDTREWRVGSHYGVHVYAVNPDGEDDPIASFLGPPEQAQRLATQMVHEHAMLSAPYADEQHQGGHWLDVLPQRPRWAPLGTHRQRLAELAGRLDGFVAAAESNDVLERWRVTFADEIDLCQRARNNIVYDDYISNSNLDAAVRMAHRLCELADEVV